jgi:hypothetical protein
MGQVSNHLNVQQRKAPTMQVPDQAHQRHLPRIRYRVEDGFTKERRAQTDSIQPADESLPFPNLHRVRVPQAMQAPVSLNDRRTDPGPFPGPVGAMPDDFIKPLIQTGAEPTRLPDPTKRGGETPRNMETLLLGQWHYGPRIVGHPTKSSIHIHREVSPGIGPKQILWL